jgi:hypothetical protein
MATSPGYVAQTYEPFRSFDLAPESFTGPGDAGVDRASNRYMPKRCTMTLRHGVLTHASGHHPQKGRGCFP